MGLNMGFFTCLNNPLDVLISKQWGTRSSANNLTHLNPLPPRDAVRKQEKNILEDHYSSVLLLFKNITPRET